jgi:hypothetical protein
MNRRSFFSSLAGAAAALSLDPDRALWVPGRKLISIPKPAPVSSDAIYRLVESRIREAEKRLIAEFDQLLFAAHDRVWSHDPITGFQDVSHAVTLMDPIRYTQSSGWDWS